MDEQKIELMLRRAELIRKYLGSSLSEEEKLELQAWIDESEENRALFNELTNPAFVRESLRRFYAVDTAAAFEEVRGKIYPKPVKKGFIRVMFTQYLERAMAAIIYAAIFVGVVVQIGRTKIRDPFLVLANFAMTSDKTFLALSNGYPYALSELAVGAYIVDGPVKVVKVAKEQVTYQKLKQESPSIEKAYHTVATPRNKSQQVNFTDGSKVRVDPASVVQYAVVETEKTTLLIAGNAEFTTAKPASIEFKDRFSRNEKLTDSIFKINTPAQTDNRAPRIWVAYNRETGIISYATDPGYTITVYMGDGNSLVFVATKATD